MKGKTNREARQGWEHQWHRSRQGQAAAALEPRVPGSSSAASPSPPDLGSNFPIARWHSVLVRVGGAERAHAFWSKGRTAAAPGLAPRRDMGVASDTGSPLLPVPCTGAATAMPPAPSRPLSPPLLFLLSRRLCPPAGDVHAAFHPIPVGPTTPPPSCALQPPGYAPQPPSPGSGAPCELRMVETQQRDGRPCCISAGGGMRASARQHRLSRVQLHPCLPSYLVHT